MKKLYVNVATAAVAVLAVTAAQGQHVSGRTRVQVDAAAHAPDQNVARGSRQQPCHFDDGEYGQRERAALAGSGFRSGQVVSSMT